MIGSWGKKEKFFSSLMRNDSRIKTFVQREDKIIYIYQSKEEEKKNVRIRFPS